jgi:hypothetical protein
MLRRKLAGTSHAFFVQSSQYKYIMEKSYLHICESDEFEKDLVLRAGGFALKVVK